MVLQLLSPNWTPPASPKSVLLLTVILWLSLYINLNITAFGFILIRETTGINGTFFIVSALCFQITLQKGWFLFVCPESVYRRAYFLTPSPPNWGIFTLLIVANLIGKSDYLTLASISFLWLRVKLDMFSNHILYFCNQVLELDAGAYMYSSYILSCWIPSIIPSCWDNLDPDSVIPTYWPSHTALCYLHGW